MPDSSQSNVEVISADTNNPQYSIVLVYVFFSKATSFIVLHHFTCCAWVEVNFNW